MKSVVWQSVYAPNDFVDFGALFPQIDNAVAYAHLYLYADKETPCTLVTGSDDGLRAWLNGEMVYSLRTRRAADPNQDKINVTLKSGWNRLLVKVDQGTGAWGFYLRLETSDGKTLTGITYALDKPEE